MTIHTLRRRLASLGTVLGLGIAMPFAVGVTPAYAVAQLEITKTHTGDFPRGGQGTFTIRVSNPGNEPTLMSGTRMTDVFPAGLTATSRDVTENTTGAAIICSLNAGTSVDCQSDEIPPGGGYTLEVVVSVATDAPCTVTNTATVGENDGSLSDSASDTVDIPGPNCNGGNGDGTSILPINLSGLIPIYNNINTNNNVLSPGASNTNSQTFRVNATP
ncbi:DUF11 domain-containing protein [Streptomyces bambusae]|uniref:DUF11 domain-containing protein n=1 Tax=Streptomyces bambusae TaxID=1550616 RepID=A0ABS6YZW7_9ACTN|nr:DUF11 domain-containing protein [Streptomyces bambusae]MBW5481032.1 DUF11 domain-containing protein [Streptomyces bambusae]